ncbi:serine protease [Acaricomes phytoseiuli]|uniref:trypsin-like serine peptidase n=1 Tax=Acaricomes phytoseiuli TaxID=291968 RepID=UPI0003726EB4|nr:serine protease [Acaricomes phytoseiuli]MCW1249850.1 serine protease [Acaricomes phytoseiuli]
MLFRHLSAQAASILAIAALAIGGLGPASAATAAGTAQTNKQAAYDGTTITPVGYSVVNGQPDLSTPLDASGLTAPVGYTSVAANFMTAESIIGPDNRRQIKNTRGVPYRAVAELSGNSLSGCTGWLISADTMVTAGHCVFSAASVRWTTNFEVRPGRNGDQTPYGSCRPNQVWTDQRWVSERNWVYDWAVLKLDCSVGQQTGWFGFRTASDAKLKGLPVTVTGYPGDKPLGTMWSDSNKVASVTPAKVFYPVDTMGGQSGSPVYDSNRQAVAIHNYGTSASYPQNSGTRLSPQLFSTLARLKDR